MTSLLTKKQITKTRVENMNCSLPKIAKMVQSSGKVMQRHRVFFKFFVLFLLEFVGYSQTINAVQYCNILHCLCAAIKAKWFGLLSFGVVLLNDNTWLPRVALTPNALSKFRWTVIGLLLIALIYRCVTFASLVC